MDRIERKQLAYDIFKQGYNCCQSVVLAFADVLPLDRQTLEKISIGFGAGMGRTRNLCGSVSAFAIVIGLLHDKEQNIAKDKEDVYRELQSLTAEFEKLNKSVVCSELLKNVKDLTKGYVPDVRDENYYKTRPCAKFVTDSAGILNDWLQCKGMID